MEEGTTSSDSSLCLENDTLLSLQNGRVLFDVSTNRSSHVFHEKTPSSRPIATKQFGPWNRDNNSDLCGFKNVSPISHKCPSAKQSALDVTANGKDSLLRFFSFVVSSRNGV